MLCKGKGHPCVIYMHNTVITVIYVAGSYSKCFCQLPFEALGKCSLSRAVLDRNYLVLLVTV